METTPTPGVGQQQLGSRFSTALVFAAELHREQRRKGSRVPYVSHLLGVASLALEHGANEDEAIAALLHEVEDQGGLTTAETIGRLYGEAVTTIVLACSNSHGEGDTRTTSEKKAAYVEHLRTAGEPALLVSAADKLHNARTILTDLHSAPDVAAFWSRFTMSAAENLAYYRGLVAAFRARDGRHVALARELATVVEEMARYVTLADP